MPGGTSTGLTMLQEDIDRYVRQRQVEGWSASSAALFRHQLEAMGTFLRGRGCRRVQDVLPADLDAYLQRLKDEGLAHPTRVQIAHAIRRFFRTLQDDGRLVACPSRDLPIPDDGEEALPKPPLSQEEVTAIIDALPRSTEIDLRNRAMLEVLYGCGLRRSELVALHLDDINRHQRTLHVRTSKHGQERLLPILGTALAAVQDWQAVRRLLLQGPDTGALFLSARGRRLTKAGVDGWFRQLNEERGRRKRHLHPHLFRHSIAVHLLQGGADVRYIQQFLGHGDLETTKVYLRLVPGRLKEEYEKAMPEIEVGNL